jgi:hypothetical protein
MTTCFPALRHCNISDESGEKFYHNVLNKAFKEAYEEEEIKINSDVEKVNILLNRLSKPDINPFLDVIINHSEKLISKIF